MAQEEMLTRLRKIEGQVRGLQRMVAEGRECDDILTQVMATRAALDRIALSLAERHLDQCMGTLLEQPDGRTKILRTMELFLRLSPTVAERASDEEKTTPTVFDATKTDYSEEESHDDKTD